MPAWLTGEDELDYETTETTPPRDRTAFGDRPAKSRGSSLVGLHAANGIAVGKVSRFCRM